MWQSWARARNKVRALLIVAVAFGPWMLPGLSPGPAQATPTPPGPCGVSWSGATRLGGLGLLEVSGFVASARHPGVAWMIRDSANPHSLYSFRLEGDQPRWKEFPIAGAANQDWEDISYSVGPDGQGRIWILENTAETTEKKLYEVSEPDPATDTSARLIGTYRLNYPGGALNTEAMFALPGRLVLVAKTDPNRVFELPLPLQRNEVNRPTSAGRLEDVGSYVTATATSADDGLLMTVSATDVLAVFASDDPDLAGFVRSDPIFRRSIPDLQFEAGDFFPYASCDILVLSEDGSVWRLSNPGSIGPLDAPDPPPAAPSDPVPPAAPTPAVPPAPTTSSPTAPAVGLPSGYWMIGVDGIVYPFGDSRSFGQPLSGMEAPAADLEPTPSGNGYWTVDDRGRVEAFGDARHLGDVDPSRLKPSERVTSLSRTPTGDGYRLFTERGRAFAFGDAAFLGDMSDVRLNGPVLDSVGTASGWGYYMVGSDGGVFAFGDAVFRGSLGGLRLNAAVRSLVPTGDGSGYWLVGSDGGVFAFGDAVFRGSMGGRPLNRPVAGMARFGAGYLMVGEDGGIFNFSDEAFRGSLGGRPPAGPIVAVASTG